MQEREKELHPNAPAEDETVSESDVAESVPDAAEPSAQELANTDTTDTDGEVYDGTDATPDLPEAAVQSAEAMESIQAPSKLPRALGGLVLPKGTIIIGSVVLLLCLVAATGVGVLIGMRNRDPWRVESGLVDYGGLSSENGSSDQIVIPGYGEILLDADTRDVMLILPNPSGNPCYFRFSILLKESGEVIYTSGLVPPGKAIGELRLKRALSEGNYPATIQIETFSLDESHTPMNGANVETVLNLR